MIMSQAITDAHQASPMTIVNGFDVTDGRCKPMDLSTPVTNGTPTIGTKRAASVVTSEDELPAGQISPSRRRSTRASALKAQEKIKLKEDGSMVTEDDGELDEEEVEKQEPLKSNNDNDAVSAKKRKIDEGYELDQTHHTFFIQQEEDGDVYEVKDGTDISSLNEEELSSLKANYDKILARELTDEQKRERLAMIKKCEAELRLEETRLLLMKKISSSQTIANQKALEAKKLATSIPSNSGGSAYKPTVALPKATSVTSTTPSTSKPNVRANPLAALAALTPEQQRELLQKASANPQMLAQLLQLMSSASKANGGNSALANLSGAAASQQHRHTVKEHQATKEALLKEQSNQQSLASMKTYAALSPQERAANARHAFRQQADKQLSALAGPKPYQANLNFIPNPNQPDFCYLVGLDITVQRILKDKGEYAPEGEVPYECEQCHTDFTPCWKAVGTPGDYHLFCEQCVLASQKKKTQKEHTNLLRRAFNKVSAQEKEFEKQIADGKLDAVMAAAAAQAAQQQQAAAHSSSHSATASSSLTLPSTSQTTPQNLSLKQNGTSTPSVPKSSTPIPSSTPKNSSSTSTPSSSHKKSSSSSSNSLNAMQAQMVLMQQMMRSNPMMAMLGGMSGSGSNSNTQAMQQMMAQLYNPMMLSMLSQQYQQSRGSQSQTNPATALLMQAVSMSQGQGNQNFANMSVQQMAQIAALSQQAAFMSNMGNMNIPGIRQLAEQMKRSSKK